MNSKKSHNRSANPKHDSCNTQKSKGLSTISGRNTGIGTTVIIADNKTAPSQSTPPPLLFLQNDRGGPIAGFVWTPEKARTGPLSIT
jgi:hypothetical protein